MALATLISIPVGVALSVGLTLSVVLAIAVRPIVSVGWLIMSRSRPSPPAPLTAGLIAVSRALRGVNGGHVGDINVFVKVLKGFRGWRLRSEVAFVAVVSSVNYSHSLVLRLWLWPRRLYEVSELGLSLRPTPPPETYRK